MHSEAEIRAAAARAGCRVLELRQLGTPYGTVWYGKLACPTNPHTFSLLLEVANVDLADPLARSVALSFYNANPKDPKARAIAIQEWIKTNVAYIREPKETFQSPTYTIRSRAGDCDDHANLYNSIANNAGLVARIVPLTRPNGDVKHAVAQVRIGGVWQWAETTVDAAFGEAPQDAVKRLGLGGRDDMH